MESKAMARDVVCGMSVDPATAKNHAEHRGHTYYFCSARCREKFLAEPEKYLTAKTAPAEKNDTNTIYTYPMHPEIRQKGPGSCPICGMALEPLHISATVAPNRELIDMTRRFWIGLLLTLPIVALEMAGHLADLQMMVADRVSVWIQFALSTPVVLWAGWPFFQRGWRSLANRSLNMFTLIAL